MLLWMGDNQTRMLPQCYGTYKILLSTKSGVKHRDTELTDVKFLPLNKTGLDIVIVSPESIPSFFVSEYQQWILGNWTWLKWYTWIVQGYFN